MPNRWIVPAGTPVHVRKVYSKAEWLPHITRKDVESYICPERRFDDPGFREFVYERWEVRVAEEFIIHEWQHWTDTEWRRG